MNKLVLSLVEIQHLIKAYREIYKKQEDEYEIGVVQGIDFVLFLMKELE